MLAERLGLGHDGLLLRRSLVGTERLDEFLRLVCRVHLLLGALDALDGLAQLVSALLAVLNGFFHLGQRVLGLGEVVHESHG